MIRKQRLFSLTLAGALAFSACGDDGDDKVEPVEDAGSGEDPDRYTGCTTVIEAGSDTEAIQTALIEVKTGETLCFADGEYEITNELSLTVNKVTIRGNPKDREAVVLDYEKQTTGKDALSVDGADFTIEHLTIRNSGGNSIVVKNTERPTFRNLKVYWEAGSKTDNGAYAVYPLSCTDVLVEDCEVIGASDAGIYVGQSKNIIVRNNVVHGNVAGIEIENSDDALVTGNHTYDNTCGILVFVMPNLEKKDGHRTIVENNKIENNNHENFAEAGTTVSFVPAGLGMLLLANDGTEVRGNTLTGNGSAGVMAISFRTYATVCSFLGGEGCGAADAGTDQDASKTYVHSNTFTDNGAEPSDVMMGLFPNINPIENVIWDGRKPVDAIAEDQFCVGATPSTLRVIGDQENFWITRGMDITDPAGYTCELPALTVPELPQDK